MNLIGFTIIYLFVLGGEEVSSVIQIFFFSRLYFRMFAGIFLYLYHTNIFWDFN